MTSPRAPSTADLAAAAAETIRQLNHHTQHPDALTGPADLDRAVAELAAMAARLPQLLRQLDRWLQTEQHAGRIRTDDRTDPAAVVDHAAAHLDHAGRLGHELGCRRDDAHQHLAHLGVAAQPGRRGSSSAAAQPRPRHRPGRNGGHQRARSWPPAGRFADRGWADLNVP